MKFDPESLVTGTVFGTLAVIVVCVAISAAVINLPRQIKQPIGPVPTNQPAKLELGSNDLSGPAKVPCYVIPEALAVTTPQGVIVFVHEYHANELARKFPSRRLTNVIIYAK